MGESSWRAAHTLLLYLFRRLHTAVQQGTQQTLQDLTVPGAELACDGEAASGGGC